MSPSPQTWAPALLSCSLVTTTRPAQKKKKKKAYEFIVEKVLSVNSKEMKSHFPLVTGLAEHSDGIRA